MDTGLKNKTAIITGATSGIGAESARLLAAEGCNVVITGRREDRLLSVQKEIESVGGKCAFLSGDMADEGFAQKLVDYAVKCFGSLDIMVYSAGMALRKKTLDMPLDEWNQVMKVNLTGPLLLSQACIRRFLEQGNGGKIVYIDSTAGKNINMGASPSYGASKAALLYLTRHLATEFAPNHIYVNSICPGPVETEITQTWTPEHRESVRKNLPLGRIGQPSDIANAVVFLASKLSDYITGESLLANGGRFME